MDNTFLSSKEQEKMVLENRRLVYYIAKKLNIIQDEFDDFVSIGTIGLIKATASFDTSKNIKFVTYAARCIENEMLMYIRKEKRRTVDVSLDEPLYVDGEGNKLKVSDVIASEDNFAEDLVTTETFVELISIVLNRLTKKERMIMLYKIADVNQSEVAKQLKISQSYASRLERKLSKKIRTYMNDNKKYKEVFKMAVMGDTYRISFYSKDIDKFNRVLATVLENTKNPEELPDFKVISEDGRVRILIPAHPESFAFIAKIIQKIEDYTISFVWNKEK